MTSTPNRLATQALPPVLTASLKGLPLMSRPSDDAPVGEVRDPLAPFRGHEDRTLPPHFNDGT
jgi:hypothetical protein